MRRSRISAAIVLVMAASATAGPPTLPAVTEVIDYASIGAAVATAGGLILTTWAVLFVGFRVLKKLLARVAFEAAADGRASASWDAMPSLSAEEFDRRYGRPDAASAASNWAPRSHH